MKINSITLIFSSYFLIGVIAGTRKKKSSVYLYQYLPCRDYCLPLLGQSVPWLILHDAGLEGSHRGWNKAFGGESSGRVAHQGGSSCLGGRSGRERRRARGHPCAGWICRLIDYIATIKYSIYTHPHPHTTPHPLLLIPLLPFSIAQSNPCFCLPADSNFFMKFKEYRYAL